MTLPTYRPITQHDRMYGVSAMAISTAMFSVATWGMVKNDSPSNLRNSWLIVGWSILLFFGSMMWLIMNYRWTQRPWWKIVGPGGSCSGAATGLAILLSKSQSLFPVAYGMWAWTIAVVVVLSVDSRHEGYASYANSCEQEDVPEYAIGMPHDPRMNPRGRS